MNPITSGKLSGVVLLAVVASLGLQQTASAQSKLTYSLEATSATGSGSAVSANGKSVTLSSAAGQSITLNLYVILHGTDQDHTNDGALNIVGSFYSGNGGLRGNFRGDSTTGVPGVNNVNGFSGPTSQSGVPLDSDGDTDLDVGRDATWKAAPADDATFPYFVATSTQSTSNIPTFGTGTGGGTDTKLLVGTTTLTITGGSGQASLVFIPHLPESGSANSKRNQKFTVDGTAYVVDATGANATLAGTIDLGAPIGVSVVPEPAAFGLAGLGAVGLLIRRRRQVA